MIWVMLHPQMTPEMLGFIPSFLDEDDPRCARDQIDANYHFGGWNKFDGFTLNDKMQLEYPGDPPIIPLAMTVMRDEVIIFYQHSWLLIKQKDESFEVARLD